MKNRKSMPPPEIRLYEPAVDFLDNRRSEYHPGFANSLVHYDPQLQRYTDDSQATTMGLRHTSTQGPVNLESLFSEALELLRTTTEEPKRTANAPFRIRDKHSWDEVEKEVVGAQNQYMNDVGKFRKLMRKAGDRSGVTKPYLNLIPNGTYTSILSVGGNMLIDVCAPPVTFGSHFIDTVHRPHFGRAKSATTSNNYLTICPTNSNP
jgi:hypothetical protein